MVITDCLAGLENRVKWSPSSTPVEPGSRPARLHPHLHPQMLGQPVLYSNLSRCRSPCSHLSAINTILSSFRILRISIGKKDLLVLKHRVNITYYSVGLNHR